MHDDGRRATDLPEDELEERVAQGETTFQEVSEEVQEGARREAADRDEVPDDTVRHQVGGFGSGQGMGTERTGQEPDRPDEEGFPRGQDEEWPH